MSHAHTASTEAKKHAHKHITLVRTHAHAHSHMVSHSQLLCYLDTYRPLHTVLGPDCLAPYITLRLFVTVVITFPLALHLP